MMFSYLANSSTASRSVGKRRRVNGSTQSGRKEICHCGFEIVGLFYVRYVPRPRYFNQLAVRQILSRFAPQHGPIAKRSYRFGGGVATEEDAAITLTDDEQHR